MKHSGKRLEKLIFKKVELWIVLLIILFGLICSLGLVAGAYYVGHEGRRLGVVGNVLGHIARAQIETAALFLAPGDPLLSKNDEVSLEVRETPEGRYRITKGVFTWPNDYTEVKNITGEWSARPLVWVSGTAEFSSPVLLLAKLNDQGNEALLLFDRNRQWAGLIPVQAKSLTGRYEALVGAQPQMIEGSTDLIIYPEGGDGLYRTDLCGNILWSRPGIYHHNFSIADGVLGILGLPKEDISDADHENWNHSDVINLIDVNDGRLIRSVTLNEIVKANLPFEDIFLHEQWRDLVNADGVLGQDKVHLNKVEILSREMADEYPMFPAGAMLLSSRNLNLLVVVHPETLKILWHSSGHTQVQHDPVFVGRNKMLVFNNSYEKNVDIEDHAGNFSSIMKYDFGTGSWTQAVNAREQRGYTFHSGELDASWNGHTVMTLTLQGRYIESDAMGREIFELVNVRNRESAYWTKHAQYVSDEQARQIVNRVCR